MADPTDLVIVAYSPSKRKMFDVNSSPETAAALAAAVARSVAIDNVAACATADGSDAGTTQTLANALKVSVNAILTALKEHGLMVADA